MELQGQAWLCLLDAMAIIVNEEAHVPKQRWSHYLGRPLPHVVMPGLDGKL